VTLSEVLEHCSDVTEDADFDPPSFVVAPIGYCDTTAGEGAWYAHVRLHWE
jgi:hypothetical protein